MPSTALSSIPSRCPADDDAITWRTPGELQRVEWQAWERPRPGGVVIGLARVAGLAVLVVLAFWVALRPALPAFEVPPGYRDPVTAWFLGGSVALIALLLAALMRMTARERRTFTLPPERRSPLRRPGRLEPVPFDAVTAWTVEPHPLGGGHRVVLLHDADGWLEPLYRLPGRGGTPRGEDGASEDDVLGWLERRLGPPTRLGPGEHPSRDWVTARRGRQERARRRQLLSPALVALSVLVAPFEAVALLSRLVDAQLLFLIFVVAGPGTLWVLFGPSPDGRSPGQRLATQRRLCGARGARSNPAEALEALSRRQTAFAGNMLAFSIAMIIGLGAIARGWRW